MIDATFASKPLPAVAQRYAKALYALAEEKNALNDVEKELRATQQMVASSADLSRFIANPLLRRDVVVKGLDAVLTKAGIAGLAQRFFHVVIRNGRAAAIPMIIEAFLNMLAAGRGEVVAEVTSARPLDDAQKAMIASALQGSLVARGVKKVTVAAKVDASVLGGVMIQIGSSLYDGTLKGKLQKLAQTLKAGKAA